MRFSYAPVERTSVPVGRTEHLNLNRLKAFQIFIECF